MSEADKDKSGSIEIEEFVSFMIKKRQLKERKITEPKEKRKKTKETVWISLRLFNVDIDRSNETIK
jgi:hypothetical protein